MYVWYAENQEVYVCTKMECIQLMCGTKLDVDEWCMVQKGHCDV